MDPYLCIQTLIVEPYLCCRIARHLLFSIGKLAAANRRRLVALWEPLHAHLRALVSVPDPSVGAAGSSGGAAVMLPSARDARATQPVTRVFAIGALISLIKSALLARSTATGNGDIHEGLAGTYNDRGLPSQTRKYGASSVHNGGDSGDDALLRAANLETIFVSSDELPADGASAVSALSQRQLLTPLARVVRARSTAGEAREAVLVGVHELLESCGQLLSEDGWPIVFEMLGVAAVGAFFDDDSDVGDSTGSAAATAVAGVGAGAVSPASASSSSACLAVAFKALRLVCDDFLDLVPRSALVSCVACVGAFATQRSEPGANVALAATGMLWTIADLLGRTGHTESAVTTSSAGGSGAWRTLAETETVWASMFRELSDLGSGCARRALKARTAATAKAEIDVSPAVRNCAVNTLFSLVLGNGRAFPLLRWQSCLDGVVLPLLARVDARVAAAAAAEAAGGDSAARGSGAGSRMLSHHSSDTEAKQWGETHVTVLQGVVRTLRTFGLGLLSARARWFGGTWDALLTVACETALRGATEGALPATLASIELLVAMVQLTLAAPAGGGAERVRVSAGMRVLNGALTEADSPKAARGRKAAEASTATNANQDDAFTRARAVLWRRAWAALCTVAAKYRVDDDDGKVASALIDGLQRLFDVAANDDFARPARAIELVEAADVLILAPRTPDDGSAGGGAKTRRYALPSVSAPQRAVLKLLESVARAPKEGDDEGGRGSVAAAPSVVGAALRVLCRYAQSAGSSEGEGIEAAPIIVSEIYPTLAAGINADGVPRVATFSSKFSAMASETMTSLCVNCLQRCQHLVASLSRTSSQTPLVYPSPHTCHRYPPDELDSRSAVVFEPEAEPQTASRIDPAITAATLAPTDSVCAAADETASHIDANDRSRGAAGIDGVDGSADDAGAGTIIETEAADSSLARQRQTDDETAMLKAQLEEQSAALERVREAACAEAEVVHDKVLEVARAEAELKAAQERCERLEEEKQKLADECSSTREKLERLCE